MQEIDKKLKMKPNTVLNSITNFNGVYLSGFFISNPATVTALSLLFEKVYLPNQLEILLNVAKKRDIRLGEKLSKMSFEIDATTEGSIEELFKGLTDKQQETAKAYMLLSHFFVTRNHELFPHVFTTDMFKEFKPLDLKLVEKGGDGKNHTFQFSYNATIITEGTDEIASKMHQGFVPIVGHETLVNKRVLKDNKAVASLLAMKSVEMLLPSFVEAKPEDILEARERLKDHLPPFWSSMFKLSTDAKKIINESKNTAEAIKECQNIVDTVVRPALVDVVLKIEKERRNWFFKVVSPLANAVKLFVGNPSLNPAALVKGSLAMATDMTADYIQSKQKIEDLKAESGLTYLLEVHKQLEKKGSS